MKILLINPPRSPHNGILEYAPEEAKHFIHKKLIGPPLGLLTIAAAARDHDVTVLEMKGEYDLDPAAPPPSELVERYMVETEPDMVGVTVIASEFDSAIDILRTAKRIDPDVTTVAGGLHATVCPDEFSDPSVDLIMPGQSAGVFMDYVRAHEKGRGREAFPGIILNGKGERRVTPPPPKEWDPAGKDFIFPDRSHLARWMQTYRVGDAPGPSTYVFTSLGCPYRCTFCSIWSQFDGRYFQREVESVIEELKMTGDYPVVRFADANTIVDRHFIERLFDRIMEEEIKKTFIMDIRFDTAVTHPALIEKLARGGLQVVICGFESFREEDLRRYRKGAPAHLIEEAIRVFHDNGIMVRGNYVIPPDYTAEDFRAMADYASSHRVVYAGYTILTPMPGSALYAETKNQIIDFDLAKYNFFNSVFETKMPIEEFYENVGRLWLIKEGPDVI